MITTRIVASELQKEIDHAKGQWKIDVEDVIQTTEVMRKIAKYIYEGGQV